MEEESRGGGGEETMMKRSNKQQQQQQQPGAAGSSEVVVWEKMKRCWLYFAASFQESCTYVKALVVGQAKKLSARSEKEAAEADLQATKLQVDAADAAETTKKQLS